MYIIRNYYREYKYIPDLQPEQIFERNLLLINNFKKRLILNILKLKNKSKLFFIINTRKMRPIKKINKEM